MTVRAAAPIILENQPPGDIAVQDIVNVCHISGYIKAGNREYKAYNTGTV
jgi:hypothetical protein